MAIKHLTYACIPLIAASMSSQAATVDQLNRQVQKLSQRIAAQDQRFRVNGFATFGLAMSDEEVAYNGVGDDANFKRFSKMGVQMTFNLDNQNSVVTQLVSRGNSGWDTKAEWAYFKHDFNNGLSSKIGRIRLPAFALSEFLDVGYAVPWAQMPEETYDVLSPFSNMDGADLSYNTDIGDLSATFTLSYGRSTSAGYDLKDILATSASVQADSWNARLAYSVAEVAFVDTDIQAGAQLYGGDIEGIDGSFTSLGFTYDPGDIYFTTEYTKLEVDGPLVDADSLYATLGYRIGQWMPLITYAITESKDDNERSLEKAVANTTYGSLATLVALTSSADPTTKATAEANLAGLTAGTAAFQAPNNRNTTRIGLGVRYDMSPGAALKIQYDIIDADTTEFFDNDAYAAAATPPDGTNILTISIDTVF